MIGGKCLCNVEEGSPGSGAYTQHGYIFSSLAGCLMKSSENGLSINSRCAKVHILHTGSTPLKNCFRGTIRKEDVRATEKTRLKFMSLRPEDIVLAKVISLGDAQSNHLLTTAENELRVVVAPSESGVEMVSISWCEMQCPKTHTKEFQRVAQVQPEFLQT
ncbi:exosome complex component CSL4-like [Dasypus novemcinctus]|uniref:exosome complex component CSL4-like n=1 Tax=Dasypus novemcinctus TaxID=9361 RepID=UPI0039C97698